VSGAAQARRRVYRPLQRTEVYVAGELEDLARRLTALELRVEQEAGLRGSLDRDHSALELSLRSQGLLLQALAVTQSEHTATLNKHTVLLDIHTARLDQVDAKLGGLAEASQVMIGLLNQLIERE
jgi:hypothetical protein